MVWLDGCLIDLEYNSWASSAISAELGIIPEETLPAGTTEDQRKGGRAE